MKDCYMMACRAVWTLRRRLYLLSSGTSFPLRAERNASFHPLPCPTFAVSPPFASSSRSLSFARHSPASPESLFTFDEEHFLTSDSQPRIFTQDRTRPPLRGPSIMREPKSSHFRKDRAEANSEKKKTMKKKKRPPPGPHKFEDLTAKRPSHSDLPFDFQHSYTETPKLEPVKYQEQFSPFGPGRLDREWDGVAARKRPDSESSGFAGCEKEKVFSWKRVGRRRVSEAVKVPMSRDEIIGKPLTKNEEKELMQQCIKTKKQINIGRDGLTHNMLIVIHHHWKHERAVRIRCKGVSTVDMENICFHLEDKTGGKIIHRAGGTVYLFRGRNYNYRNRPHIPMMLWRPHSPIYPRLLKKKPEDLSFEEANAMRKRGHKLMPLCKLAKNGYYGDLVKHVREAFEDDDLVRIDCKGLNVSDMKKIGAKLRDLVPCILLSFQKEQIIMWRGRDWKLSDSGETKLNVSVNETSASDADGSNHIPQVAMLETTSSFGDNVEQRDAQDIQFSEDDDDKEDHEISSQNFHDSYPELDDLGSYSSDSMSSEELDLSGIFSSSEETEEGVID